MDERMLTTRSRLSLTLLMIAMVAGCAAQRFKGVTDSAPADTTCPD
jgi:hypothetical protein